MCYNDTDGELADDVHVYVCCECMHCLQQTAIYIAWAPIFLSAVPLTVKQCPLSFKFLQNSKQ